MENNTQVQNAPTDNNLIHKDNLTDVALCFDCIRYLVQEIDEDYFARYDRSNPDDVMSIAWEYNRNRAKINAVSKLLCEMEQIFEANGITAY